MNINIKTYPAKNGDCFLISYGNKDEKHSHLLIDCGYTDTVTTYLKNDLIGIGKKKELLGKMILTHIDADHIKGAIKLLTDNNSEKFIEIKDIWHNTFRHLFNVENLSPDKKDEKILSQIIQRGYPMEQKGSGKISAEQGSTVGALILQGNYPWNKSFNGSAICIENGRKITIDSYAEIFLLSPNAKKLEGLKKLWKEELKKYGTHYSDGDIELYDDAFEMLMSWDKGTTKKKHKPISFVEETIDELLSHPFDEDTTPTNGSSTAFILSINNKKMLFLADAHPDLVVESLNGYQEEEIIVFDLIKVSHHGCFNNISKDLLEKIDATSYLISTSGTKHNHPEKETIAQIISRSTSFHRNIYFNYITNTSKFFDREDWMKKYNYSIHYLNQPPYTVSL